MAGMASCVRCGSELPAAARFCPTCGRPADPEMGPPAPPAAPPIWSGVRLPAWLTTDWPLVGLGVTVLLAVLFTVSALFGAVAGVA
ncbi:MAG: zinc-ribbon domain-containing protein, partial [Micromonosporaceae bacterium]